MKFEKIGAKTLSMIKLYDSWGAGGNPLADSKILAEIDFPKKEKLDVHNLRDWNPNSTLRLSREKGISGSTNAILLDVGGVNFLPKLFEDKTLNEIDWRFNGFDINIPKKQPIGLTEAYFIVCFVAGLGGNEHLYSFNLGFKLSSIGFRKVILSQIYGEVNILSLFR